MKKKHMPKHIQSRLRKYLEYAWNADLMSLNKQQLFSSLSINLKEEIITLVNGPILKKIKFIYLNFSTNLITKLIFHLEEQIFGPEENLFEVTKFLFFFE